MIMEPAPLIDEIRETRRQTSAEFDRDPPRLMAHYFELGKQRRREGKCRFYECAETMSAETALNDKSPAN